MRRATDVLLFGALLAALLFSGCTQFVTPQGEAPGAQESATQQERIEALEARVAQLESEIDRLDGALEEQETLISINGVNSFNTVSQLRDQYRELYNYLLLQCVDIIVRNGGQIPDPSFDSADAYCAYAIENA